MSDKRASELDDIDSPLIDELARFQSLLAATSLPASRVNRDELLYRAGWAAAQTQSAGSSPMQTRQRGHRNTRRTLAWSCASAFVAASLATVITLQLHPSAAKSSVGPGEVVERDESAIRLAQTESSVLAPHESTIHRPTWPRRQFWDASLLNMREHALRGEWDDLNAGTRSTVTGLSSSDNFSTRSKTSRELLLEFTSPRS